jgi:predicted AAA+ superfamily ATPase
MHRDFLAHLLKWQQAADRKPLVVKGARQTGKTYVLKQFGAAAYAATHLLNFEADPRLAAVFDGELDPRRLLCDLALLGRFDPAAAFSGEALVFFDEIQACPRAVTSLKYFAEQLPEVHLVAAGSLLGVELSRAASFPVGKVQLHTLHPLNFFEFLDATGRGAYRTRLEHLAAIEPLPAGMHAELIAALREYLVVGGMPEAVAAFTTDRDFIRVRRIQENIVAAYRLDFAKHAPPTLVPRLAMLWEAVPGQLARENRRFLFSAVRQAARARDYEDALLWLEQAGLVHRSFAVATPKLPLAGYCNRRLFKLFSLDVGLLGAVAHLNPAVVVEGNAVFEEFKGAVAEQYVAQQLVALDTAAEPRPLAYWRNEKTGTEVDFLIEAEAILPLEVKSGVNPRSKSLASYGRQFAPPRLLRASLLNFKADGGTVNIPLYLLPALGPVLALGNG